MSPADFLAALAEPTRLRVVNCLATSALYVSDLVAILDLPQPTVSRHLQVLRSLGLAQGRRHSTRVAYELTLPAGALGGMVRGVLRSLRTDPAFRADAAAARRAGAAAARPLHVS